jgi:hypothetical protein
MSLAPRIVLHSPVVDHAALESFVEQCLKDDVQLIAVWGEGAEALEEEIDWIVIGDGIDDSRYITTSSHPKESLDQVLEFASHWKCERDGLSEVSL